MVFQENGKKLGFGMMRLPLLNPEDDKSIDIETLSEMVDAFIEKGFTYFDTAWMYCGFESESAVKKVLVDRYPRERFTLATKLHAAFIHSKEDRDEIFNEQLRKTGAGFFDYYLIHDVGRDHYSKFTELDCFTWIQEKKAQGLIKHIGFSFHDNAEVLDRILTEHPEMEFVQLQLNYLDWDNDAIQSRLCYEAATKHGKPVIVMEPVKGGTLATVPEDVEKMFEAHRPDMSVPSWAIRFAASLDNVKMVLSGMGSMEMIEDNTSYMSELEKMTEEEYTIVKKAVDVINASIVVPCTGCSYCTDGCPMNIAIPKYFSLYNADKQEASTKAWTSQGGYYSRLINTFGKASDCVQCGQCESVCPQHLPIIKYLEDVAQHFEKKE